MVACPSCGKDNPGRQLAFGTRGTALIEASSVATVRIGA
jgi:hypothetical protein